jgi:hypothetical protein
MGMYTYYFAFELFKLIDTLGSLSLLYEIKRRPQAQVQMLHTLRP